MPQSLACLNVHVIFSTKDRVDAINPDLQPRLYEYIGGVLRSEECQLLHAGGMGDHVHLLASLSREICVADALRAVKTNSSKWIHETFPPMSSFAWQAGYAAFSVSQSNVESVRQYINRQAEHHHTRGFKEELIAFPKRHGVAYDERYVWD
ncbi:MAG: IS200/IS605 family transposase [Bacillota bacterium]